MKIDLAPPKLPVVGYHHARKRFKAYSMAARMYLKDLPPEHVYDKLQRKWGTWISPEAFALWKTFKPIYIEKIMKKKRSKK